MGSLSAKLLIKIKQKPNGNRKWGSFIDNKQSKYGWGPKTTVTFKYSKSYAINI